ncbi:hypothetical protein K523DRAFT_335198 [Schizophyllum commune Tattone D]|nr:hypothetical protein K523DRAFT_335198 [Schizophyllum commune Tattone D]
MPPSIPSTSISTQKDLNALPIIQYRLVNFDAGYFRRQMEHLEYYWGLQKGELDLSTPLNHIQLRSDMADRMEKSDWALLPNKKTLDAMNALSDFNKTAAVDKRKRFTEEYEYEFLPLHIAKRDRPSIYLKRGSTVRTINKAYSKVPRIRSRAHPLFVLFCMTDHILTGFSSLSQPKCDRLVRTVTATLRRWVYSPPAEFLVGPDVWAEHRHPSSDDGSVARAKLTSCKPTRTKRTTRAVRRSTHAPSPQPKTAQAKSSIYDYMRNPPSLPKSPVLPRSARASDSGSSDSDVNVVFSAVDLRSWLDSIGPASKTRRALPPISSADSILSRYRKEPARAPADALRGTLLQRHGGLYGGGGYASCRYIYSSNDWAMHIYDQCLWSSNPPEAARFDYVDLVT